MYAGGGGIEGFWLRPTALTALFIAIASSIAPPFENLSLKLNDFEGSVSSRTVASI